jgi:hypothetical protein
LNLFSSSPSSNFSKRTGEVAGDLQQAGADVNHRDWNGRTALHLAVVRGSKDDVRRRRVALLLSLGADPRLKDEEGMRPIDYVGQTTDGGSWCTSLPDNRRELDRVVTLLQVDTLQHLQKGLCGTCHAQSRSIQSASTAPV